MSRLPKKKSRPITVDGRTFRWMLHGKNRFGGSPVAVTISIQEDLEKPGATLQCTPVATDIVSKNDYLLDDYNGCNASIIPSDIEKIIRAGLARGWNPAEGHGTFHPGNLTLAQYTISDL